MNKKMNVSRVEDFAEEMVKKIFIEADLGLCDVKKMFGGFGLSLDENFFAIVTDLGRGPTLYLKTTNDTEVEFIKNGSSKFSYMAKNELREINYYSIPERAYEDYKMFKHFVNLGLAASLEKKEEDYLKAKKNSKIKKVDIDKFFKDNY